MSTSVYEKYGDQETVTNFDELLHLMDTPISVGIKNNESGKILGLNQMRNLK